MIKLVIIWIYFKFVLNISLQKLFKSETQSQKKKNPSSKEDKEAKDPSADEPPRHSKHYATKARWVQLEVPISIRAAIMALIRCIVALYLSLYI